MIRILIADDHPLVREGLKKILKEESDMDVRCEASNSQEVLQHLEQHSLDAVVMDISMPGKSGLDILKDIRQRFPKLPILFLSMHPADRFAVRALRLGAAGYLTKESAPRELVRAIRKVVQGGKYITKKVAEELALDVEAPREKPPHETLSDREFEILRLIASGKSVKDISEELSLSRHTVNTYRARVLEKMNMKSNVDLTQYAIRNGLVD